MDKSTSKFQGGKKIITNRGKYIASLVPKMGISSDGEESEEDEAQISDGEFEQRLAKCFEGVEEILFENGEMGNVVEEDFQMGNVNEEEVLFEDVRMGNATEEDDQDQCEFLFTETTLETGIVEPDLSSLKHQENLDVAQDVSSMNSSVLTTNSPLETCLSGSKPVTRSEKKKVPRRARATTPPNVPLNSQSHSTIDLNHMNTEKPLPSTSQQAPTRRALPYTKKKKNANKKKQPAKKKKTGFYWKKGPFLREVTLPEKEAQHQQPRKNPQVGPVAYFLMFFTAELIDYIVEQSKLYSVQETGKCVNLSRNSIYDFLAVHIYMGLSRMNSYRDYWSNNLGCDRVKNVMSRNRYVEIRRFLHFADNSSDEKEDRFFKIRPLFEYLRKKFLQFDDREKKYAIDEMMIKYKGKKAGSRKQYMPKKPIKWGFKFFGRSGVTGFIYDMLIYSGSDTLKGFSFPFADEALTFSGKVVVALCQTIPDAPLSAVFIDNWFNSPKLMYILRKIYGILSLGTLRSDRTAGASEKLSSDKEMTKKGRGAFEIVSDNVKKLCVVKWFDTKSVLLGSSYVGDEPIGKVKRFSKEAKKKVPIDCPALVKEYNKFMGGVDKTDMLVAIFKTPLKSYKWYMNIFSWLLDVTLCNSWILYRGEHPDEKMGLKQFKVDVAQGLLLKGRPRNMKTTKNKITQPPPSEEVRYDQFGHFPVPISKGKCRNCHTGQTVWACCKCKNVRLCLNGKRNCFLDFHTLSEE